MTAATFASPNMARAPTGRPPAARWSSPARCSTRRPPSPAAAASPSSPSSTTRRERSCARPTTPTSARESTPIAWARRWIEARRPEGRHAERVSLRARFAPRLLAFRFGRAAEQTVGGLDRRVRSEGNGDSVRPVDLDLAFLGGDLARSRVRLVLHPGKTARSAARSPQAACGTPSCLRGAGSVMITALRHFQRLRVALPRDSVDQPMLLVDPARPPTGQIASQRLRLSGAAKRIAHASLQKGVEAGQDFIVFRLPIEIF